MAAAWGIVAATEKRTACRNHAAIAIDESTGKVFLDAGCLARSNGSLENRRLIICQSF
jgi:hypothetical protein